MKKEGRIHLLFTAAAFVLSVSAHGQAMIAPNLDDIGAVVNPPPQVTTVELDWHPSSRDELSTTWEATELITNSITGELSTRFHHYVEIGSGLNYFDEASGGYVPSEDLIEATPEGGAAALRGPAKLFLSANLNSPEPVRIITSKGRKFSTRPLGVFWYDAQSGSSQLIAPVEDCVGELLSPNQVLWKGAFGPLADLRITYTKSAIESDLILLQQPQLPSGWDANAARIELWHEWTVPGQPTVTPRLLRPEPDVNLKIVMAEPDLTDEILDFGDLWFPTGAAFLTDGTVSTGPDEAKQVILPTFTDEKQPVAKTWLTTSKRSILVEGLRWQTVQPKITVLPKSAPTPMAQAADRLDSLSWLPIPNPDPRALGIIKTATSEYRPKGFVLDYITVPSSYTGAYSFNTGTTYFVNAGTYFSGNVTFQPGCIIKFNTDRYLLIYGSISCNGTGMNPSLLTHYREDLWGEQVSSGDCPAPSAYPALWSYYINADQTIKNMRFRFAKEAIRLDANGCGTYTYTVKGCFFEECQTSIYANNCNVTISASVESGVVTPTVADNCASFSGSFTDVSNADSDGNHLLDSDDYKYFGGVGTLPGNAVGQLAWRINGRSPTTDQPIWSVRNDASNIYVYNTSCWLYGVSGLTSVSPYNSHAGVQRAGTLITPRHAMVADHYYIPAGATIRFVGNNNVSYTRTVLGYHKVTPTVNQDYGIIVLDSDLPASVGYVRIFPIEALNRLTSSQQYWPSDRSCLPSRVPAVGFNTRKEAFIFDVTFFDVIWQLANGSSSLWFPNWGSYCRRNSTCDCGVTSDITVGDSGHPTFLLLNNELVLIGGWWHCTEQSAWHGNYLSDLNQAIVNLDNAAFGQWTGYSATIYPVTGFPLLW